MDKAKNHMTGCGCVVSIVAALVLSAIGWHYFCVAREVAYLRNTTAEGLFGECLGVVEPGHSHFGGRCTSVMKWGDSQGPMITVFRPNLRSPFFDEYRAYVLPVSKRTFKLSGHKTCPDKNAADALYEEVRDVLYKKYGRPARIGEHEVTYRFPPKLVLLRRFTIEGKEAVTIEATVEILESKELRRECALKALEERNQKLQEYDRQFREKSKGL